MLCLHAAIYNYDPVGKPPEILEVGSRWHRPKFREECAGKQLTHAVVLQRENLWNTQPLYCVLAIEELFHFGGSDYLFMSLKHRCARKNPNHSIAGSTPLLDHFAHTVAYLDYAKSAILLSPTFPFSWFLVFRHIFYLIMLQVGTVASLSRPVRRYASVPISLMLKCLSLHVGCWYLALLLMKCGSGYEYM